MTEQPTANAHAEADPRPLWQLLLAEQTGQYLPLTPVECEALLELLDELVEQGCDPDEMSRRLAHCLDQARDYQLNRCIVI